VRAEHADQSAKAPVYKAPTDNTCMSIPDFFTTTCEVAACGVRFYGTIGRGFGYPDQRRGVGRASGRQLLSWKT
jgi:hypothetical protein